jgi:predicted Rossmann fold nucleotide-binding protein DprA/Smf involved in DNA uptake
MKLALIGYRRFSNYEKFESEILRVINLSDIESIISGGAKGADTLAKVFAEKHGIKIIEFLPEWGKFGKAAGPIRNKQIVDAADYVIAFTTRTAKGTHNTIKLAKNANKLLKTIAIDEFSAD